MTTIAGLVGDLRGLTPPAEFYHPAIARRQLRQELRALQETNAESDGPTAGMSGP
jgi:hypothetical protein